MYKASKCNSSDKERITVVIQYSQTYLRAKKDAKILKFKIYQEK